MRIILKILKWVAISFCAIISFTFVAFAIYDGTFYRKELRKIQKQLNAIDGVTVLNIWGHEDEDAKQEDPIFVLTNAEEEDDFARSLHWEKRNAY